MPSCFISYSSKDAALATSVVEELSRHGVQAFQASVSVRRGDHWSERIWDALRDSRWVIFLASKSACESPYVQQELGGATISRKRVVPIVWEIAPSELPGWMNQYHAIDLREKTYEDLRAEIARIAEDMKAEARTGYLIAGAVILALLIAGSQ